MKRFRKDRDPRITSCVPKTTGPKHPNGSVLRQRLMMMKPSHPNYPTVQNWCYFPLFTWRLTWAFLAPPLLFVWRKDTKIANTLPKQPCLSAIVCKNGLLKPTQEKTTKPFISLSLTLSPSLICLSLSLSLPGASLWLTSSAARRSPHFTPNKKSFKKFGTQLVRGRIFQQTHSECAIPRATFLMAASHEVLSVTSHLAATARFLPELGKAVKH